MHRSLILVLSAAATLTLGGCGGDDSPIDTVRAAGEGVVDAGSSKTTVTLELPGLTLSGDGEYDYEKNTGRTTFDTSALAAAGFPRELKLLVDDKTIYLNLGGLLVETDWAKVDTTKTENLGPQYKSLAELGNNSDPRAILAYTVGAKDNLKEVGNEEVRGEPTTHYKGTVDLKAAARRIGGRQAEALRTVIDTLKTSTIPADFWVDDDGRLRRFRHVIDLSKSSAAAQAGISGKSTTTMEFYDFGTKVELDLPPDNEVTDLTGGESTPQTATTAPPG